jgi:outer membrane protein assembly factor BamB/fibronectin type 3 domain-containing protein
MRGSKKCAAVLSSAMAASTAWAAVPPEATTYQVTVDHAGVTTSGGALALQASPLWTVNLGGPISYPLISGNVVYVTIGGGATATSGTQLVALDSQTGKTLWGPVSFPGRPWSTAAVDGGKVFVVDNDGLLSSFDAATGKPGFSEQLPGQDFFTSPPVAASGTVYTGGAGSGGTVYAVDEASGVVKWTASVENGDDSSPALSGTGLYVSYTCPQTYDFDPATGAALWHYSGPCEGGGGKTAAYAGGKLYVRGSSTGYGVPDGTVFDAGSGAVLSQFSSGPIPAIGASTGYFLNSGALEAHDLKSGTLLWSFSGDGSLSSAPLVVDQYVIIGSGTGMLYALDALSGVPVWQQNVGSSIPAPDEQNVSQPLTGLGIADGVLVVPAGNTLIAYSLLGPPPPANVAAKAGPGEVTLTWSASAGADGYDIFVGTTPGGEASQPAQTSVTGNTTVITGLKVGQPYYFTARAVSGKLLSFASNEATATPIAALSPMNLKADAGNASVNLQWSASTGATGYNIYAGTAAGGEASTPAASGVSSTSTTITGLTNAKKYFFVVKALTGSTLSAASNEASATPELPAGPTSLTVSEGDTQLTLTWKAVSGASSYSVYMGKSSGGESGTAVLSGVAGTTATVTGLTNGTDYYFVVKAMTSSGPSAASNEVDAIPVHPILSSDGGGGATGLAEIGTMLGLLMLRRLKKR